MAHLHPLMDKSFQDVLPALMAVRTATALTTAQKGTV